jgi:hypothetical protein
VAEISEMPFMFLSHNILAPSSKLAQGIMLLTCSISEEPGSNLSQNIDHSDCGFPWSLVANARTLQYQKLGRGDSFLVPFKFIIY